MQRRPSNDPFPDLVVINLPKTRSGDSCGDKFEQHGKNFTRKVYSLWPVELNRHASCVCEGLWFHKCQRITVAESLKKGIILYVANEPGINTAHRALFEVEWRQSATSAGWLLSEPHASVLNTSSTWLTAAGAGVRVTQGGETRLETCVLDRSCNLTDKSPDLKYILNMLHLSLMCLILIRLDQKISVLCLFSQHKVKLECFVFLQRFNGK